MAVGGALVTDAFKEIRWKQRFENFEKSYRVLGKYVHQPMHTQLERAGLIRLFELTFESAWKVLKDYLETEGYNVKSPRETIKVAFQTGVVEEGHVWIYALSTRNLAEHIYHDLVAERFVQEIVDIYFPELEKLYEKLLKEQC